MSGAMTEIDFYKIPRPIQDGLLDAFRGQFTPAPILSQPGTRHTALAWLAVSATAALLLAALFAVGFGKVESGLALHPTAAVAAYVLLAAISALGVIQALAHRSGMKVLPFQPGVFLFPANVIDARDHKLRVFPLAELSSVSAGPPGAVVVMFGSRRFSFPVPEASRPEELVQQVEAARDRMRAELDAAERRKLDPLEPPAVESPLASPIPLSRDAALWERQAWLIAAAVGAALGGGLFYLRNEMSDARMFAAVRAHDDVASYTSYVARGRRHREVVSQMLLPRAELRLAVAQDSVEAIDAFIRAYPTTGIQAEVDAARRAALVAELERARKVGTLTALLSFAERYPKHGIDQAFDQAKHALYVSALARYKKEMPKGGEQNAELVGRLLAYAERAGAKRTAQGFRGPAVQIRFWHLPSQDLKRADDLVMKSPMFAGVTSLPSRNVEAARLEPHERSSAVALADELAHRFDPEFVTFEPGPSVEGTVEETLAVTSPTLVVSYRVESSGTAYASKKPQVILMGLLFLFKAEFILPGDTKPLSVKHRIAPPIPADMVKQQAAVPPSGTLETTVYEGIIRDAFVELRKRYLAKWSPKREEAR
jgi:hypothetical protein